MIDRLEKVSLGEGAADYYSQQAIEYRQKAKETLDKMLKPVLEAAAREFERRALETKQVISKNKAIAR